MHAAAALAIFGVLGLGLCAAGCGKKEKIPPSARLTSNQPATGATPDVQETLPVVGGVPGYAGSSSCRDCHTTQYESWHQSYHRTMTQVASAESVLADFNNVVLTNANIRFTMHRRGGGHWVRMEPLGGASTEMPTAEAVDVPVGLITGSHHMQVYWVPEGHGNLQIGFPFTWLIPEKRWVPRHSTFIRPPGLAHQSEAWNIVCSRCHSTGLEPRFDAARRTVQTHVGEFGIACEACHGPGEKHARLRTAAAGTPAADVLEPKEIVHPGELAADRASQVCGFCHSMKWIDQNSSWRDRGFDFRPGDDLEATTPIIRAATIGKIPGLPEYLSRHPELLADFFWSDGMIRVSGREFNGLLDSPCTLGGAFSCLSCHSMHRSEPDDLLAERGQSNLACTQCHESYRDPPTLAAHTHHATGSPGSSCYNCHMPHTTYGVLKAIRSHQISSPTVAADLATGRPNACNLCHLDKTLAWTADQLREWYQQEKPMIPTDRTNIAHAVRLAVAGDAGQRALLAWHLSWPDALRISGTNWVAPVLAQLLDDPYAAVRCVAERSLRQVFGTVPANYDFTVPVEQREPVRAMVWKEWRAQLSPESSRKVRPWLLEAENLEAQSIAFDTLLERQDHAPLRLRE